MQDDTAGDVLLLSLQAQLKQQHEQVAQHQLDLMQHNQKLNERSKDLQVRSWLLSLLFKSSAHKQSFPPVL